VLLKAAMAELAAKELLVTKWNIERQAALGLAGFFSALIFFMTLSPMAVATKRAISDLGNCLLAHTIAYYQPCKTACAACCFDCLPVTLTY